MRQQGLVPLTDFCPLDRADPEVLFHAIAVLNARYVKNGMQPGAEHWISDTRRYRVRLLSDIFAEWSRLAGTDETFPWHDDWVAELWTAFRKLTEERKREAWEYFGIEPPESRREHLA